MEIRKIFSDLQGSEKLYSVLLSEDEMTLFTQQREFGKGDTKGRAKKEAARRDRQKAAREAQIQRGREQAAMSKPINSPKPAVVSSPVINPGVKETVQKEIKSKNLLGKALETIKKNPKTTKAVAIGAGTLAAAGGGLALAKKQKKQEGE